MTYAVIYYSPSSHRTRSIWNMQDADLPSQHRTTSADHRNTNFLLVTKLPGRTPYRVIFLCLEYYNWHSVMVLSTVLNCCASTFIEIPTLLPVLDIVGFWKLHIRLQRLIRDFIDGWM